MHTQASARRINCRVGFAPQFHDIIFAITLRRAVIGVTTVSREKRTLEAEGDFT
jgi:hypothetical protein